MKDKNKIGTNAESGRMEFEVIKLPPKGINHETFDFDAEFVKGLTAEEFKAEMYKRIEAYPWKNKE